MPACNRKQILAKSSSHRHKNWLKTRQIE